ncbi:MAG TPA: hypothetical protein DD827_08825 [Gammaproteobacteria bacterium]|nr:hypothetical protein [Gammaproteobacteria bacterium]
MSHKPSITQETRTLQAVPDAAPSADSIEQIRDIIFGTQMREYAERFANLEKRLVDENAALQKSLTSRIEEALQSLDEEKLVRKAGLDDLMDQLTTQGKELHTANESVQQSLGDEIDTVKLHVSQQLENAEKQKTGQMSQLGALFRQLADELEKT